MKGHSRVDSAGSGFSRRSSSFTVPRRSDVHCCVSFAVRRTYRRGRRLCRSGSYCATGPGTDAENDGDHHSGGPFTPQRPLYTERDEVSSGLSTPRTILSVANVCTFAIPSTLLSSIETSTLRNSRKIMRTRLCSLTALTYIHTHTYSSIGTADILN